MGKLITAVSAMFSKKPVLYQLNEELFEGPGVHTFGYVKLDVDSKGQFRLQGRDDFPVLAFAKPISA